MNICQHTCNSKVAVKHVVHILVPLTSAELGGGQLFLLKLIDAMPDLFRFSIWLFENGPMEDELKQRNISYQILPNSSLKTIRGLWQLRNKLKQERPDLIYLHASRLIALIARNLEIPCVERINMSRTPEVGGWCNRLPWLDRIMTEWNTKVIAVSEAIRKQLLERGVSNEKIEVIHNFVDVQRFNRPDLRSPMRRELGIPDDAVVVLNVGRMVPQKGQSDFLKVAEKCLVQNKQIYFLLIGDGPLREDLTQQAKELGLIDSPCFKIIPFQKEIERIYAAGDILLHTAHWDPLANVLLEAMAAGLTVVATDIDGTEEAISDSKYGILFPVSDIDTAANILQELITQSGKIKTIGNSALAFVQKEFSLTRKIEEFIRLFLSVDFDEEIQLEIDSIGVENLCHYYVSTRAKRNKRKDRFWIFRKLEQFKYDPKLCTLLLAAVGRYRIKDASGVLLSLIKDESMTSEIMDVAIPAAINLGISDKIPEAIMDSYQEFLGWHQSASIRITVPLQALQR